MEEPFVDTIAGTQNESITDLRELVSRALEIPRRRSSRTFPGDKMEYWNAWYANRGVEVPGSGMADFIAYARRPPRPKDPVEAFPVAKILTVRPFRAGSFL
jgi:hypothetical protein